VVVADVEEPSLPETAISLERQASPQSLPPVNDVMPPSHPDDLLLRSTSDAMEEESQYN
jgi:hypothetical protein